MKALFLGSISVLADTSEIQREAFNRAFHEAGLDWYWSQQEYRDMLTDSGGRDRIAEFAEEQGKKIDAAAMHQHKTKVFQAMLAEAELTLRPETERLLEEAKEREQKIAVVSTTAKESLDILIDRLGGRVALGLDLVLSAADGLTSKPDPAAYLHALKVLDLDAGNVQAIEDNKPGYDAARAAGISCLVYPNENTLLHDFGEARLLTEESGLVAA